MKTCMNISCGTTSSAEWKTGWVMRSGELANLCDKCGYAFGQQIYCEEFHTDDAGWRNCVTCGKRLHCGCIASLTLIVILERGGVKCLGCARTLRPNSGLNGNVGTVTHKNISGSSVNDFYMNACLGLLRQDGLAFPNLDNFTITPPPPISMDTGVSCGAWRADATWASTLSQTSMGSFLKDRADISSSSMQTRDNYESVAHPNLNMALGVTSGNLQFTTGTVTDEREQRNVLNTFNHGLVSPSLAPTPPKLPFSPAPDTNLSMIPQSRVARPPVEGRGRHQLLPRYWPRITDQELQQISGDSNCTIIPLFEKVLSASDAGRIGRLVLPKACAEAYFPTITQAEGLPLKIQDVKGKEWVFQFRFWPNNNSRMYVLEGVTPCIQSMQLLAGDTVTFSRKEPEGKLIMGFRKSSNSSMQNLPVSNGSSSLVQPTKGSTDAPINALSRQLDSSGGNASLHTIEKCGEPIEEGLLSSSMTMTERKKGRNIGSKSKRLLIDNQDVQTLRLTWDEVQGMLRPPQNANPSVVVIEDFELEEYEEPPVFGKSSVFATRSSGVVEQWAQCDSCSKWRKLPAEVLLPPKWTCLDNIWDPIRCFCSAPDELSARELELFCNLSKDSRKKRIGIPNKTVNEQGASGLSALANAAVSGDNPNAPGTSAVATTTRHPRHREGCQCIVCIQPPSGKGKHKSTCTCTVCMTVRRRFKTLMMRKKKRRSDQEAETLKNQEKHNFNKGEDNIGVENDQLQPEHQHERGDALQSGLDETNDIQEIPIVELADCNSILDLNFHPEREEESKMTDQSMFMDLLQLASVPVESYMEQNGLASFTSKEQASSAALPGQAAAETERQLIEEHPASQASPNQVNPNDGSCEPEFTNKHQGDS